MEEAQSRDPHRRGRRPSPVPPTCYLVAGLAAALCLWATIPYGSVARWAQAVVVCGCIAVTVAGLRQSLRRSAIAPTSSAPPPAGRVLNGARHTFGSALCVWLLILVAWVLVQTIPLRSHPADMADPAATGVANRFLDRSAIGFDPSTVLSTLSLWFAYGLFVWTCSRCLYRRRPALASAVAVIAIGTFQSVVAIVGPGTDLFSGNPFVGRRLVGTFSSGNSFGGYLGLSLTTSIGVLLYAIPSLIAVRRQRSFTDFFLSRRAKTRLAWITLLLSACTIQAIALLLSGSRGAMTSAGVCLVGLIAWFSRSTRGQQNSRLLIPLLALFLVICLVGAGGTYALVAERFRSLPAESSVENVSRLRIWAGVLHLVREHPLGVGPGCFAAAFTRFQPTGFGTRRVDHAHNDYLELLSELGLPGFVLLLVVLLAVGRRLPSLVRASGSDASVWIWRGAAVACLAALLHATVDFNLSSRPGVALTFCLLLGMAIGFQERSKAIRGSHALPSVSAPAALPVLLAIVLAFVAWREWRFAQACVSSERGWAATGRDANDYFWLSAPQTPDGDGISLIERACRLAPRNAWTHVVLGKARIEVFARALRREVERQAVAAPDLSLDILHRSASAALSDDERGACEAALPSFLRARELSPWNADIRSEVALNLARLARIAEGGRQRARYGHDAVREAKLAVRLAPNDPTVLAKASESMSHCLNSDALSEAKLQNAQALRDWGQHALALGGLDYSILSSWNESGIGLDALTDDPTVAPRILKMVYRFHETSNNAEQALKCLDALHRAHNNPDYALTPSLPPDASPEQYRRFAAFEMAKWLVRTGRWSDLRMLRDELRAAHSLLLDASLARAPRVCPPNAMVLTLRSLDDRHGLDRQRKVQLASLLLDLHHPREASDLLLEVSLGDDPRTDAPLDALLLKSAPPDAKESCGWRLARVRSLIGRQEYAEAARLLLDLIDTQEVPYRFRHRLRHLLARSLAHSDPVRSRAVLLESVAGCVSDPSSLDSLLELCGPVPVETGTDSPPSALDLAARVTPAYQLDLDFMGGKVEWVGFDAQWIGTRIGSGRLLIRTYWRFWDTVPADLRPVIFVRDPFGRPIYSSGRTFSATHPLPFAAGAPQAGSVLAVENELPQQARAARDLCVGLHHGDPPRWYPANTGIPFAEVRDWTRLIRRIPPLAQPAPIAPLFVGPSARDFSNVWHRAWARHSAPSGTNATDRIPVVRANAVVHTNSAAVPPRLAAVGRDGYMLRWMPDGIDVDALSGSGLLNGVLALTRHVEGCRWFLPDRRFLTRDGSVSSPLSVRLLVNKPAFPDRRVLTVLPRSPERDGLANDWATCNGWNGLIGPSDPNDAQGSLAPPTPAKARPLAAGSRVEIGLSGWVLPAYSPDRLADDLRKAARWPPNEFLFSDGAVPWIHGPLVWIASRLAWDPWQNTAALEADFCWNSFGDAAETMISYFRLLNGVWRGTELAPWSSPSPGVLEQCAYYPASLRRQLLSLLAAARHQAEPDATAVDRIEAVSRPMEFAAALADELDASLAVLTRPHDETGLCEMSDDVESLRRLREDRRRVKAGLGAVEETQPGMDRSRDVVQRWEDCTEEILAEAADFLMCVQGTLPPHVPPSSGP